MSDEIKNPRGRKWAASGEIKGQPDTNYNAESFYSQGVTREMISRALDSAVIHDPSLYKPLPGSVFHNKNAEKIYNMAGELFRKGASVSYDMIYISLAGTVPASEIASYDLPTASQFDYWFSLAEKLSRVDKTKQNLEVILETVSHENIDKTPAALAAAAEAARPPETTESVFKSFAETRDDETIPERLWFIHEVLCPGFAVLTGRKAMKKTWTALQIAGAIAEGLPFLGFKTVKARVLYVCLELDAVDLKSRFLKIGSVSTEAFILYTFPRGMAAVAYAERMITDYGFQVIIFDTFSPLLPEGFDSNSYTESELYRRFRLMAKTHGALILAVWHSGKADRDDFMLSPIGSTGMIGQADTLIALDGKRGDQNVKLLIGGNHAPGAALTVRMNDRMTWELVDGNPVESLTAEEEKALAVVASRPDGAISADLMVDLGKSRSAADTVLSKLASRGKITRIKRGVYVIEKNLKLGVDQ